MDLVMLQMSTTIMGDVGGWLYGVYKWQKWSFFCCLERLQDRLASCKNV